MGGRLRIGWRILRWRLATSLPHHRHSARLQVPIQDCAFLHTNSEKSSKCRLEPTQTPTTSKKLCRRHGPIWPKLERHGVSSATCRDMSATFPAKVPCSICSLISCCIASFRRVACVPAHRVMDLNAYVDPLPMCVLPQGVLGSDPKPTCGG